MSGSEKMNRETGRVGGVRRQPRSNRGIGIGMPSGRAFRSALELLAVVFLVMTKSSSGWGGAAAEEETVGRRRPVLTPGNRIKHVVVLVMENRSFDHMLGFLKRRNSEIDGLTGRESNPLNATDPDSPRVFISDSAEYVDPDPGHSFQAIREQIFGGNATWQLAQDPPPMNGFAQNAEALYPNTGFPQKVMSAFRPDALPSYTALADEFVIFDRWFASVPASTEPNRFYVHSATSHGAMSNFKPALIRGFPQKSIFDSIHENGLSFGVYFNNVPTTLFFRSLRSPKYFNKFHSYLMFKHHARLGKLPNYVVIEPRYFDLRAFPANDDHPSHDASRGQEFVKGVYETLRHSPAWKETLLIITYDEHGGFYDHVPTPIKGVPNPDGLIGPEPYKFDFKRLGVRVPTIMVSPWLNKGKVYHEAVGPTPTSQYEHSSIPATVRKIFGLKDGPLTKREAWAGTFEHILMERDSPRDDCPKKLPKITRRLRNSPANENAKLTEFQQEIVEMAALLNGDTATADAANRLTVREGNDYCEKQVRIFLEKNRAEMEAEMEGNASLPQLVTSAVEEESYHNDENHDNHDDGDADDDDDGDDGGEQNHAIQAETEGNASLPRLVVTSTMEGSSHHNDDDDDDDDDDDGDERSASSVPALVRSVVETSPQLRMVLGRRSGPKMIPPSVEEL